ncbi:hypothetical protein ANTPLA_LOCUS2894 [Anthophora plagiata]
MAMSGEDSLRKLVEEGGRVKSQLTKFKNFCDQFGTTTAIDSLQERLNRNITLIDKFDAIQERIEALVAGSPEEEAHRQIRDIFETMYFDVVGRVRGYVQRAQNPMPSATTPQHSLRIATSPAMSETAAKVRLPSIPLPSFNGSLGDWVYFRDSFESLINRNEGLSNIERFYYLKSSVKGEAARALKFLAMSNENYSEAWKLLHERYEDTNELIDHHVGAIFDLPSVAKESPIELRQLLDDFNNNLSRLNR